MIESIPKKEIVDLWKENNVDVADEIKTDPVNKYKCGYCGLIFYDPKNAGGNKFYSRLGEFEWYYLHPGKTEYDYIQQWIKEGDHVLDVGSGRGVLFTKTQKKIHYTGLELSSKAAELGQQAGINVINEDLLIHAASHQGVYDLVCLFQVLEHLTELDEFIEAIKRSMKPGGYFCVAVPNNDGFIRKTTNNAFNMPPHHTLLWSRRSLEYLGRKFGLTIKEVHNEELQDVHKEWYMSQSLIYRTRRMMGKKHRTVNMGKGYLRTASLVDRVRNSRLFGSLVKKLFFSRKASGHSIIVVYQKPV